MVRWRSGACVARSDPDPAQPHVRGDDFRTTLLSLKPNDNQGVRFCWEDLRNGRTWEEMQEREEAEDSARRRSLH